MLRFSAAVTTSLMLLVAGAPAGAADEIRATSGLTTAPEVRTEIDSATYVVDRLGRLVTVAAEHAWVPCMDDQGNRADDAWLRDRLLVSRLTDKGDPDPTWGPPRRVTIPNFSYMVDVWIDEADRIHLSAQAETLSRVNPDDPCGPPPEYPENTPNVTRMVEMRLTPHGAPDETFGPGGIREARDEATPDELLNLPYPPSYSRKGPDGENLTVSATNRRYAVDPQGRVVAAVDHVATNATNDEWRSWPAEAFEVHRFLRNADGRLVRDPSYGDGGRYLHRRIHNDAEEGPVPVWTELVSFQVEDDGRAVLTAESNGSVRLLRLTAEGKADTTFGTDGLSEPAPFSSMWRNPVMNRIRPDGRGGYFVVGWGPNAPLRKVSGDRTGYVRLGKSVLYRLTSTGRLDTSFGTPRPGPVRGLRVVNLDRAAVVSWDASNPAPAYYSVRVEGRNGLVLYTTTEKNRVVLDKETLGRRLDNGHRFTVTVTPTLDFFDGGVAGTTTVEPRDDATPPRNVTVSDKGNGTVSVRWDDPADDGGAPVLRYVVTADPTDGRTRRETVTDEDVVLRSLRTGVKHRITVTAVTKYGPGRAAAMTVRTRR